MCANSQTRKQALEAPACRIPGSPTMTDPLYVSRSTLEPRGHLHRRAHLATGETFDLGVHGEVAAFFQIVPPRGLPLPVDYIVAATGG
jgi:hypothetical protein